MTTTNDTRQLFLDFFAKNGHEVMASSPLVPHNDPTLMFANAGMNQFKNVFTGAEKPKAPRAATSQKCVRAGGKHNDLDNVGYTARHHTFFEMLGNFSFGDYFKEGAIKFAWELLTKEYGLDKSRLTFTVYHTDDEAFTLWKKITGCDDARILRVPTKDNFWSMGDTGPCGPCSEIFYDHGAKAGDGEWALNADGSDRFGSRFVEIWNLVFMQYEQVDAEKRIELPKPSIDTGMGLERIAAVTQGVHDNYDIDLFKTLIKASVDLTGVKAEGEHQASHRVIADHLRSSCFLMADGVMPSNEGRGYVLRRIMRRAMRHAHILGCKEPLMHRLVPALIAQMGGAYPELKRAEAMVTENLKLEEERFKQTLDRGLKLLEEEMANLKKGGVLSGEVAFKLYDTYGFPLDLTEDILRGRGQTVDNAGFNVAMERQKDTARAAWSGSGEKATGRIWFEIKEKVGATTFLGYEEDKADATILALVKDGAEVASAGAGEEVSIVTDRTPFYGESGGQMGDCGAVSIGGKLAAEISDTQKPLEDFFVHKAKLSAALKVGDKVHLAIDLHRRTRLRANHSATHILHEVLRRQLGEHVTQKGSLVAPDKLRFDISHPKAVTKEELAKIEREVNEIVWHNSDVATELASPEEAQKKGAMALFGEKYGDIVRVVSMGGKLSASSFQLSEEKAESRKLTAESPFSVELCGGTHVRRTGDIGLFKIVSESAVAAGIRRIEALTGEDAYMFVTSEEQALKDIAETLKASPAQAAARVEALVTERKKLEKELAEAKKALALGGSGGAAVEAEQISGVAFIAKSFGDVAPKDLRGLAENFLKTAGENGVVAVATGFEDKASIVVAVAKGLTARISAVDLVQAFAATVGGKGGGGRPDMAQAGGPDAGKIEEALGVIRAMLAQRAAA